MNNNDYNSIQLDGDEFYHLTIAGEETLFASQDGAVEAIREQKEQIDLSDPDVSLAVVETGDEWEIKGVPWQTIALQLL